MVSASAAASSAPGPSATASTSAGPAESAPETPAAPSRPSTPSPSPVAAPPPVAAAATPAPASTAPAHYVASPPAREAPLQTSVDPAKGSLVAQASRALSSGATARAVELARQAVAANPGNADAWLTLGAAYQASGNPTAARDAYRSCMAQAHSANLSECRVLAGP